MVFEPFSEFGRLGIEADVFTELEVWYRFGTVTAGAFIDPFDIDGKVMGQLLWRPKAAVVLMKAEGHELRAYG